MNQLSMKTKKVNLSLFKQFIKIVIVSIFSFLFTTLHAQLTFTNYTPQNSGLNVLGLKDIKIDKMGIIWLGTDLGLTKFDGINWVNYTAANYSKLAYGVRTIAIDSIGNKWLGTYNNGIVKFDGTNWINYDTLNSGLASNSIYSIEIDFQGNIWASTPKGISKFNGTNWTKYNFGRRIFDITVEPRGNHSVWFVEMDTVFKYDGSNWQHYTKANLGYNVSVFGGFSIEIDKNNNIWLSPHTQAQGVYKFDGSVWTRYFDSTYTTNYASLNEAKGLLVDEFNNIWFSCGFGPTPAYLIKCKDTSWTFYLANTNASGAFLRAAIDSIGNKWYASYYNGLFKYDCLLPTTPTAIAGVDTVVKGQGFVTYKVPPIDYANYYVWLFPNGFTGTSNTDTITVDVGNSAVSGDITVYGNSKCGNGNPATLHITVLNSNTIDEETLSNKLTVFPNPTTTQTTISYPLLTNEGELQIYNILGQLVCEEKLSKTSSQKEINTQNFKAGLYKIIIKEKGIIKGQVSLVKE